MKCPKCKKTITTVDVWSNAHQKGTLKGKEIISYSSANLESTQCINCPKCGEDIRDLVKET
jgi:hypothetical protein